MNKNVLVVDDSKDMCLLLDRFLSRHNFQVKTCLSGKEAQDWLKDHQPDIVLADFKLDDINGIDLLRHIKSIYPHLPVIIITGYSDVKHAVEVMKLGAYDYVTKPLFPEEILLTVQQALEEPVARKAEPVKPVDISPAEKPKSIPVKTDKEEAAPKDYIFGNSADFNKILDQIRLVAPTNYSVIIYGETGSGKEAIAQHIHRLSNRSDKPFVAIDCGALSKELAASELFGHEKGSFTGALQQKIGHFELAHGGTVFLDEIANLSYDVQVSLLRVIQERKMKRIGGNKDIDLDVRIIVASNENLWDAARKGKFREDLYHRFNEFSINLPPLRERKEDLMTFARFFLQKTNAELGKNINGFSKDVEEVFLNYVWPGNLRELKNVVKRATLLSDSEWVELRSLPFEITNFHKLQFTGNEVNEHKTTVPSPSLPAEEKQAELPDLGSRLKSANLNAEYQIILEALRKANFNKSQAAKLLQIDRKTLYNKMKQFNQFLTD